MQTAVLNIEGMEDVACADKITELLRGIPGVSDAQVSLRDSIASVLLDASRVTPPMLARQLSAAGYPAAAREAAGGCCGGCCGG
ncbi:heavy-metal-associated domain-containing protein [Duganella radicis]|uniref:Copper chaperone n=1 Tax=Duganella radicis TaxID=551988 RepID=A0A6L6PGW5_9BURK|nr:heavy-metal-associated domain-containing protein [Duganella radicis]MTV37827.1 copper chaperone [Duganella radicis]